MLSHLPDLFPHHFRAQLLPYLSRAAESFFLCASNNIGNVFLSFWQYQWATRVRVNKYDVMDITYILCINKTIGERKRGGNLGRVVINSKEEEEEVSVL